ncbi:MAG: hypothetical protein QM589_00455 [Thermomicrobiales bacterium]
MTAQRWSAGSAVVSFPLQPGTPMGGYMARTSGVTDTQDPLQIGVLHLETHDRTLTLVTADVIGVDGGLRDRIAGQAGLDPATVLVCASHTHSGPHGIVHRLHPIEPDAGDDALRETFVALATGCIHRARVAMEPIRLGVATADASGAWTNRNAQDGPNDPRLRLLVARREDESLQTLVTLTPCHPTVLGAESTVVSADLSGGIRRAIGALPEVRDATILSLTGAAGDVSTRFVRETATPAEIDRLAKIATRNVSSALASIQTIEPSNASLRHRRIEVALPTFRENLAPDPHAEMLAAHAAMDAAQADAANAAAIRHAVTRYQGALLRWQMASSPTTSTIPTVAVDAWAFDHDVAFVSTPVELFSSLGRRIEQESPFPTTLVVGYTNGYAGYVADTAAWDAGTYEALASPFARRAGDALVDTIADVLRDLHTESG